MVCTSLEDTQNTRVCMQYARVLGGGGGKLVNRCFIIRPHHEIKTAVARYAARMTLSHLCPARRYTRQTRGYPDPQRGAFEPWPMMLCLTMGRRSPGRPDRHSPWQHSHECAVVVVLRLGAWETAFAWPGPGCSTTCNCRCSRSRCRCRCFGRCPPPRTHRAMNVFV